MTVDQFVSEHLTSPQPGARPGYLAQHQLLAQVPALRRDILVPDYCYTGLQVRCKIPPHTRSMYRVSRKTVPTWLFALLSASTHANCKSWDIFEKFRKFAT